MSATEMPPPESSKTATEADKRVVEAGAAVQPLGGNEPALEKPTCTFKSSSSAVDQPSGLQKCEDTRNATALPSSSTDSEQARPVSDISHQGATVSGSPRRQSPSADQPTRTSKPSVGTLWTLSSATATIKDKAQQQKRALFAFQQRGGLVRWLHGDSEDLDELLECEQGFGCPAGTTHPTQTIPQPTVTPPNSPVGHDSHALHTLPGPQFRKESSTKQAPEKPSLLDSLFDKVVNSVASTSLPSSPSERARVTLRPTSDTTPSSALDEFLHRAGGHATHTKTPFPHMKATRQRAATTDQPFSRSTEMPVLSKSRSDASLGRAGADRVGRFSLDEVLADEWLCTVLWAHLYSSVVAERDHQHHQRLSFLMETSFHISPLYEANATATRSSEVLSDSACHASRRSDYEALVASLKRLRRRFLLHRGATTASEVPAASPITSNLKNDLCMAVNRLNSAQAAYISEPDVKKVMALLQQLAREVEREFRVLATKSCSSFADSALYHEFVSQGAHNRDDIASLLRASRIPFYQEPNVFPESLDLGSLVAKHASLEASSSIFTAAGCQAFSFTAKSASSNSRAFEFTALMPVTKQENGDGAATKRRAELLRTIEPFLNPTGTMPDVLSKPLAFNFIAGGVGNRLYGAVLWFSKPVDGKLAQNEELVFTFPDGVCITSRFPLVDSLRHFLNCFWQNLMASGDPTSHTPTNLTTLDSDAASATLHSAMKIATRSFDAYVLARHSEIGDGSRLLEMDSTLGDLFECLSLTHVLRLFALALLEKKIVLVASSYSVLLASGQALRALLHPLKWSHVFVPVLPLALKGCLHCPTPFIFGLHDAYVRRCEMPKPSVDLVVVNLDRDTLTGGGDVFLPPARHATLHAQLSQLCRPHLAARDSVDGHEARASTEFPAAAVRRAFQTQLGELLVALEPCVSRFEFSDKRVSVVDVNCCTGLWPADSARFSSALLHTQAVSTQLASR